MPKKTNRVMTRAIADHYKPEEQLVLSQCFQILAEAFPKERHFTIGLASRKNGEGEKVWYIIDETDEERIETMLFASDY
jgi:hypothetical protein